MILRTHLIKTPLFTITRIQWQAQAYMAPHAHDGLCVFAVKHGCLTEHRGLASRKLGPLQYSTVLPQERHAVQAVEPSESWHVYFTRG
jgi:quercetin dioxygenase-like cupin family protein